MDFPHLPIRELLSTNNGFLEPLEALETLDNLDNLDNLESLESLGITATPQPATVCWSLSL